jgi:hypothetical protein
LQREDESISDTGATVGDSTVGSTATENAESETQPTREQQLEEIRVRREDLMRQMSADIANYALERERAFGQEHEYRLHSPQSSPEREKASPVESDDNGNDTTSSNGVSPRTLPARVDGHSISRPSQNATSVTDSALVRDPTEDFTNALVEASSVQHRVRRGMGGIPNSRGTRIQYSLAPPSYNAADEQDQARFRQAAGILAPPCSTIILVAESDGMDVREGIEFLREWDSFSTNWQPLYVETSDTVPISTIMFWTTLRWGWGRNFWRPSRAMRTQITSLLQEHTIFDHVSRLVDILAEGSGDTIESILISQLRGSDFGDEERGRFLRLIDDGQSPEWISRLIRNWIVFSPLVEDTRLPSEDYLTRQQLRCDRLERLIREARLLGCREGQGETRGRQR